MSNAADEVGAGVDTTRLYCWYTSARSLFAELTPALLGITANPRQMAGVPCIRGLRIPVATVVGVVADGLTDAETLKAYPALREDDIRDALRYAAEAVRERELPLAAA